MWLPKSFSWLPHCFICIDPVCILFRLVWMDIAFIIFFSLRYSLGATFKMLKAVLKKSREGGKGTKKDPGMNINTMFLPQMSWALQTQDCPTCGAAVPVPGATPARLPCCCLGSRAVALGLPGRRLQCSYSCICTRQDGWEQLVVVVALEILRAGCVCCAASSYMARGQACWTLSYRNAL